MVGSSSHGGISTRPRSSSIHQTIIASVRKGEQSQVLRYLSTPNHDPNLINDHGDPILTSASKRGHTAIVRLLLQSGADANKRNVHGMTPLMYAYEQGHMDVVDLLMEYGADWNIKDKWGKTAHFYLKKYMMNACKTETADNISFESGKYDNTTGNALTNSTTATVTDDQGDLHHDKKLTNQLQPKDDKMEQFIYSIQSILDLKIVYSILAQSYRCDYITQSNLQRYIRLALEHTSKIVNNTTDSVVFKYILKKAQDDGIITEFEREKIKMDVMKSVLVDNNNCIVQMKRNIHSLQTRVDTIKEHIEQVEEQQMRIKRIKAIFAFPKAVLNFFSLGIAGSTIEALMDVALVSNDYCGIYILLGG